MQLAEIEMLVKSGELPVDGAVVLGAGGQLMVTKGNYGRRLMYLDSGIFQYLRMLNIRLGSMIYSGIHKVTFRCN